MVILYTVRIARTRRIVALRRPLSLAMAAIRSELARNPCARFVVELARA